MTSPNNIMSAIPEVVGSTIQRLVLSDAPNDDWVRLFREAFAEVVFDHSSANWPFKSNPLRGVEFDGSVLTIKGINLFPNDGEDNYTLGDYTADNSDTDDVGVIGKVIDTVKKVGTRASVAVNEDELTDGSAVNYLHNRRNVLNDLYDRFYDEFNDTDRSVFAGEEILHTELGGRNALSNVQWQQIQLTRSFNPSDDGRVAEIQIEHGFGMRETFEFLAEDYRTLDVVNAEARSEGSTVNNLNHTLSFVAGHPENGVGDRDITIWYVTKRNTTADRHMLLHCPDLTRYTNYSYRVALAPSIV